MLLMVKCLENHFVFERCLPGQDYFVLKSNRAMNDKTGHNKRGGNSTLLYDLLLFMNIDDI